MVHKRSTKKRSKTKSRRKKDEWEIYREMARKIFKNLKKEEIQEIRQRIIEGDYPRNWEDMVIADSRFKDYIGAGLYYGLVSAPSRHTNIQASNDVYISADYLNVKIPKKLSKLSGLKMAEVWENILTSL